MKKKNKFTLTVPVGVLILHGILISSCDKKTTAELVQDKEFHTGGRLMGVPTTTSSVYFLSTFEEASPLNKWGKELPNANAATITTSPTRAGGKAIKMVLNKTDATVAGSKRAELVLTEPLLAPNAERWYGISTYLPSSYVLDPRIPESIFQWHHVPNFKQGETWSKFKPTNPLRLETNNGRYVLVHAVTSNPSDNKSAIVQKSYDLGPYQTGAWVDWVLHWKMSYKSDGILELWKNGQKVVEIKGPTYYNDESGPYFKMGIYKWGWAMPINSTTSQRTIYYDEIRAGNENASYNDVTPSGSAPAPAPTPTPTPTVVFAVNSGGSTFKASNGITYKTDTQYSGGGPYQTTFPISNTSDDVLYQSERSGKNFSYSIPLNKGTYEITFRFAEKHYNEPGVRQFDILAEGIEIIQNLDVFKVAGRNRAYDIIRTVNVTDGTLNIETRLDTRNDNVILSALHVIKK